MKPRPLPSNTRSERLILGELLLNNAAWEQAQALTEDDFLLASHKRIFACLKAHLTRKRPIDTILLIDAMRRRDELKSIGGEVYLSELTTDTCPGTLGEHMRLLREKSRLRYLMETAHNLMETALAEEDSLGVIETHQKRLLGLPSAF